MYETGRARVRLTIPGLGMVGLGLLSPAQHNTIGLVTGVVRRTSDHSEMNIYFNYLIFFRGLRPIWRLCKICGV